MTFAQQSTTIERRYFDDFAGFAGSIATSSMQRFLPAAKSEPQQQRFIAPIRESGASLLRAFVITSSQRSEEENLGLAMETEGRPLNVVVTSARSNFSSASSVARIKRRRLIELVEAWLADETGYDEEVWPLLKDGIEASRTSTRKRFRE